MDEQKPAAKSAILQQPAGAGKTRTACRSPAPCGYDPCLRPAERARARSACVAALSRWRAWTAWRAKPRTSSDSRVRAPDYRQGQPLPAHATQGRISTVFIVIYTLIWLACSLTICLLSFFVGRCARKLPVIDDGLPWALHRSHVPYATKGSLHGQADGHTRPPGNSQASAARPATSSRPPTRTATPRGGNPGGGSPTPHAHMSRHPDMQPGPSSSPAR